MATIIIDQNYNAYEIVYKALNKPVTEDMFKFEDCILTVEETTQKQLEEAVKNYDHQAYLNSIKIQPKEDEILSKEVANLKIDNMKKDLVITNALQTIASLKVEVMSLKGGNV